MQHAELIKELEKLVHTGELPRSTQASTAMLLGRLQTVVNVRLMGPDRSAKVGLVAALAGCNLESASPAEIWLHYGEQLEVTLHFHDGSSQVHDELKTPIGGMPIRIDVAAPIAALRLVSLHLVGELNGTQDDQLTGSHAFQDADIVLWCTSRFTIAEAEQWNSAPDHLKYHSFLVKTGSETELSTEKRNALEYVAEQHFYALHFVNLTDRTSDAPAKLLKSISQIAKSGRLADEDSAALLLRTHRTILAAAAPVTDPIRPLRRPSSPPKRLCGLYAKAVTIIQNCAEQIAESLPQESVDDLAQVVAQCTETSQTLAELFDDEQNSDVAFQGLKNDVLNTSDQMTLMTLEAGMLPAIDAVTTLVQLKRDFEMRCAA